MGWRTSLVGLLVLSTAPTVGAQTTGTDNRDGRWVLLEEGPVHPLEFSPSGEDLWVANIGDGTVSVIDIASGVMVEEVGAALGPVTIRHRPESNEMWVVCQSSGAILIFDASTRRLLDSISPRAPFSTTNPLRVGGEPCGLVFSADGGTAYVSLGVLDQVVAINASTRTAGTPFDFSSAFLPTTTSVSRAQEPRAMTLLGTDLYVLSFESGNGTIPISTAGIFKSEIRDMWSDFDNAVVNDPPPDRDALVFDVSSGTPTGTTALWRMGTLNFDLQPHPSHDPTLFYVSNVDFNNATRLTTQSSTQVQGEFLFSLGGIDIARHRVTYAPTWDTVSAPPSPSVIDLNDPNQQVPEMCDERFAVPNEMVFDAAGERLYVACYESKNTAVIDVTTDTVIASLRSSGVGPRGVLLDEANGRLYVFNRAEQTVDEFAVPVSAGTIATPLRTINAGYDPTPARIKQGRRLFLDAANSVNGLQSCNVCHMDGHFDRIAWDLGEHTGPLAAPLSDPVGKDLKGTKVTMSLRAIEETAPFHWRGDRADLIDFNPAFVGLLGGSELGGDEFASFQDFVFALTYPPNPKRLPTRVLTADAAEGLDLFVNFLDSNGEKIVRAEISPGVQSRFSCHECHGLEGFNGTNNQLTSDLPPSPAVVFADNPTALRGLFDKSSDVISYPSPPYTGVNALPSVAWGFLNAGVVRSVSNFVDLFTAFSAHESDMVETYLDEFDTGLAPVTSWSHTITQANTGGAASSSPVPRYLLAQRAAGNCDAVARGWTLDGSGTRIPLRMDFDPALSRWVTDNSGYGPYTYAQLHAIANAGNGVFCFFGVPVGMGWRFGRDRDLDFQQDADESAWGASSTNTDTDGDGQPDGFEIRLGSDPNDDTDLAVDASAPTVSNFTVVWHNSTTAKLRWTTDEESFTKVRVQTASGPVALDETTQRRGYDVEHVVRIRHLRPGHTYDVTVLTQNPAASAGSMSFPTAITTQAHLFNSLHVSNVTLSVLSVNLDNTVNLRATVEIVDQDLLPVANATASLDFVEWLGATLAPGASAQSTGASNAFGIAFVDFRTTNTVGSGATVDAFVVPEVTHATLLHFHPAEKVFSDQIQL